MARSWGQLLLAGSFVLTVFSGCDCGVVAAEKKDAVTNTVDDASSPADAASHDTIAMPDVVGADALAPGDAAADDAAADDAAADDAAADDAAADDAAANDATADDAAADDAAADDAAMDASVEDAGQPDTAVSPDAGVRDAVLYDTAVALDIAYLDSAASDTGVSPDTYAADGAPTNQPPQVHITSPEDGVSVSRGQSIDFFCAVTDLEDGTIANQDIIWTSSIDNQVGVGSTVLTGLASSGQHTITCTATDSDGASGQDSITVNVLDNFLPQVTITEPNDGDYYHSGDSITFTGEATDTEDGQIPNTSLRWLDGASQLGMGGSVQTALADGDHVITLQATDTQGGIGIATITIHVVSNIPPLCTISSPGEGDTIIEGDSATFTASCTDPDGETVANTSYIWSSNLDGQIGIGASVTNTLVSLGDHAISLCVEDTTDSSLQACYTVGVTVAANQTPQVSIVSPVPGDISGCEMVALECAATDPEGGSLDYTWISDVEGELATNANGVWAPGISGSHLLTCSATDPRGATGTDQVTVYIASPAVNIMSPDDGEMSAPGSVVVFVGTACDTEDGEITGTSLVWSSSIDGQIDTGNNAVSNTLSPGEHSITLTATDSNGNTGQDVVTLWVNNPPTITIDTPADESTFLQTDSIHFTATTSDPEDGTPATTWNSNMVGDYGTGNSVLRSLPMGVHSITATATDSAGETAVDSITVYVEDGDPLFYNDNLGWRVYAIEQDPNSGHYWIATQDGLGDYNSTTQTMDVFYTQADSELPDNLVRDVAVLADNTLMLATENGLALCPSTTTSTGTPSSCQTYGEGDLALEDDTIRALLQLPNGTTLVGTENCLMFSDWTSGHHRSFCRNQGGGDGLIDDSIRALAFDSISAQVWIATANGVSLMTPAAPSDLLNRNASNFSDYRAQDGLPSNDVSAIAIAPSGLVWFATNNGLAVLDRSSTQEAFTTYRGHGSDIHNNVRDVAVDVITIDTISYEVAWGATEGGLYRVDHQQPSEMLITTDQGLLNNNCYSLFIDMAHVKYVGTNNGLSLYRGW